MWSWGSGDTGCLGHGDRFSKLSPVQIAGLAGVAKIFAGWNSVYAILNDKTVRGWGDTSFAGPSGYNSSAPHAPKTEINNVADLVVTSPFSYVILQDGTRLFWDTPIGITFNLGKDPISVELFDEAKDIQSNGTGVLLLKNDGTVWALGYNYDGQLGLGLKNTYAFVTDFTQIEALDNIEKIFIIEKQSSVSYTPTKMAMAIKNDGTVYCWGNNSALGMGEKNLNYVLTPTYVRK